MRNELLVAVQAVIQTLPQHYQDVIQWRNYERVPFEVIGQRLGRSAEASQQLWVRALDALQQELDWSDDSKSLRSGSELQ